jgi:hypothetical protein
VSVTPVEAFTPYSTALGLASALPTWMDAMDAQRIAAYQVYEQIYWNVDDTFVLIQRGSDASPIYIPTARTIVDTTNRFLCPKPGFIIDPDIGTPQEQEDLRRQMSSLFRRERFWGKYIANKRYGIIRGDWCWHIIANPNKLPGKRITIEPLDPAAYFPIPHPQDPDKIIGAHIVEQFQNDQGDVFIKRQTYYKGADPLNNDGSDTTIYNSIGLFDVDAWQNLADNPTTVIKPPTPLPPQITAIPIYHIPNIETPGDPFGSSELRGFERVLAAINQGISDEELILALEGLGMYATDGGPPRDEQNRVTNWQLGPGMVVEHGPGSKFERVSGVSTVAPIQDHLKFLINALKEASGTPDAAVGKVDVQVAESGIALMLQLGPLLAKVDERGETVTDVHMQMYHDIAQMWLPAYEQFESPTVPIPVNGDPLPENRDQKFKEIIAMATANPPIVDLEWVHSELNKLGYDFPKDTVQKIMNERQAFARATDPFASRMDEELDPNAQ